VGLCRREKENGLSSRESTESSGAQPGRAGGGVFRSLRTRNYRLYFWGQLVSVAGTMARLLAQSWLVLDLSNNSGTALGIVNAAQFLPILLLGAHAGVVADKVNKRRLLLVTQSVMALASAVLAALVIGDVVTLWMVYLLVFISGLGQTFDSPARQAFVNEMVEPEDLINAIGLNAGLFNLAQIAGPAAGGVLILLVGTGGCFVLSAVSFLAVIGALLAMRTSELHPSVPTVGEPRPLRAGLRYLRGEPDLLWNIALMSVYGLAGGSIQIILPLLAKLTFHGNAVTLSVLSGSVGLGSVMGAVWIATRSVVTKRLLIGYTICFGTTTALAALAPTLFTMALLLVVTSAFMMAMLSCSNSMVQINARSNMRGRVLAIRLVAIQGGRAIGSPLLGLLVGVAGVRFSFAFSGIAMAVAAVVYIFSPDRAREPEPVLIAQT
jgi:MFS family permease